MPDHGLNLPSFPVNLALGADLVYGGRVFVIDDLEVRSFEVRELTTDVVGSIFVVGLGRNWFALTCYATYHDAAEALLIRLRAEKLRVDARSEVLRVRLIELARTGTNR